MVIVVDDTDGQCNPYIRYICMCRVSLAHTSVVKRAFEEFAGTNVAAFA